jgi:hypothetical protein
MAANGFGFCVRFLAYRMFQVTDKLNSQKLTLRCCYVPEGKVKKLKKGVFFVFEYQQVMYSVNIMCNLIVTISNILRNIAV